MGEERQISEEGQRNIHKFGMNPKTNLTAERFQGRNGKGKRNSIQNGFFIFLLEGLENKCSIMIYLGIGVFSSTLLVAKSLI